MRSPYLRRQSLRSGPSNEDNQRLYRYYFKESARSAQTADGQIEAEGTLMVSRRWLFDALAIQLAGKLQHVISGSRRCCSARALN
jgi:hypothetical protein